MASAYEEVIRLIAQDDTRAGVRSAETALARLQRMASLPIRIVDMATAPLRGIMSMLGRIGLAAQGIQAGAQLARSLAQPLQLAGDLEQAVANISTIKPGVNISAVSDALNEMQRRIPQTAAELGAGLYDIFSSIDVSVGDGLQLIEKFGRGAVGAMTDAKTFGTAVIGVMNAYHKTVADADHISDVFFNTVKSGVVTGEQLAGNLGLVTQAGRMAGVSIDELGALIVGVTKEGGDAAQNINNLNNLLLKITTIDAQKSIHELGVRTLDANGGFRSQIDVLGDLNERLQHMNASARTAAIQKIFPDLQARAGAMVIMGEIDNVRAALEENMKSSGSASAAFQKMVGTYNSQMKILHNTISSVFTSLGAIFLPMITPLLTAFSKVLIDNQANISAAFKSIGDEMPFVMGIASAIWHELQPALLSLFRALGNLWQIIKTQVIPMLGEFWQWLSPKLESAANAWTTRIWPALQDAWKNIHDYIVNDINPKLKELSDAWDKAKDAASRFEGPLGLIAGALDKIRKTLDGAKPEWDEFLLDFSRQGPLTPMDNLRQALGSMGDAADRFAAAWGRLSTALKFGSGDPNAVDFNYLTYSIGLWRGAFQLLTDTVRIMADTVDDAAFAFQKLAATIVWAAEVKNAFGAGDMEAGYTLMRNGPDAFFPTETKTHQAGGWLTEPIVGVGLDTGARYSFVENRRPEYVSPAGSSPGGGRVYLTVERGAVQVNGANGPIQGWADAADQLWIDLDARLRSALSNRTLGVGRARS